MSATHQQQSFADNGYLLLKNVIDKELLISFRAVTDRFCAGDNTLNNIPSSFQSFQLLFYDSKK